MSSHLSILPQPDDPDALFHPNGPLPPSFIDEAIRTLMRTLPLGDADEPTAWTYRRMHSATRALAAMHPRDEIEVMIGVQALAAYHAAAALWRLGMNLRRPHGDSTRHITAAGSAARTFDSLLRALERRQAKPLSVPQGRPAPRCWPEDDAAGFIQGFEDRCRNEPEDAGEPVAWTAEAVALVRKLAEDDRIEEETHGLDLERTEGILPGGGMIMPEEPTPQQEAYITRRLALQYRREVQENRRRGITKLPKIRPLRTGDRVP